MVSDVNKSPEYSVISSGDATRVSVKVRPLKTQNYNLEMVQGADGNLTSNGEMLQLLL